MNEEDDSPLSELASLKRKAPESIDKNTTDAINKRSGGLFFGKRIFADKVPIEWIALVVIVLGLVLFFVLYQSDTGSLVAPPDTLIKPRGL